MLPKNSNSMLGIAFSWHVVAPIGLSLIGLGFGVLSMTPPENKIAIRLMTIGFALLAFKLSAWVAFERPEATLQKAFLIALICAASGWLWYVSIAFAQSKGGYVGPDLLTFDALSVGVGGMPERQSVSNIWDSKPWNEELYSDVRLTIGNNPKYRTENLDLTITLPGKDTDPQRQLIAAIDQLSRIGGVEFPKPQSPETNVLMKGQDGNTYNMPFSFDTFSPNPKTGWWLPTPSHKVFVPKLFNGEKLKLILGTILDGSREKIAPKFIQLSGTYEIVTERDKQRISLDRTIEVR